jgi:hypothetical protein
MPGGHLFPVSTYPVTAPRVFPYFLRAAMPEGLGYEASLGTDAIWRLFYRMPAQRSSLNLLGVTKWLGSLQRFQSEDQIWLSRRLG